MRGFVFSMQGQPSIRILYKGTGPLNGCVSLSGQSVPYLAQCIRAVVVMATRLKEAVQKVSSSSRHNSGLK